MSFLRKYRKKVQIVNIRETEIKLKWNWRNQKKEKVQIVNIRETEIKLRLHFI